MNTLGTRVESGNFRIEFSGSPNQITIYHREEEFLDVDLDWPKQTIDSLSNLVERLKREEL